MKIMPNAFDNQFLLLMASLLALKQVLRDAATDSNCGDCMR